MSLYPDVEPYETGHLHVGGGHRVYWEVCGNPDGKPAVVLHGGPGSGCTPWHRRLFDPARYRIVLFDQRNCGRSTPHASESDVDLSTNTTQHLIADIERLREHLDIERWLVLGGSWGSTLALAYAEAHPAHVSELVLFGVTTGRHSEVDWTFRGGIARFFPVQWTRLLDALPPATRQPLVLRASNDAATAPRLDERAVDVVEAYHPLLNDADPAVCRRAAEAWCLWESATPDWPPSEGLAERFRDPAYALAFARIVTHYMRHNLWLEDGVLLRNAGKLAGIPGVLINGRFDLQAPLSNAWELRRAWPRAELIVVDDAGHAAQHTGIASAIVRAIDGFARTER